MKILTKDLIGPALDWFVAKIEESYPGQFTSIVLRAGEVNYCPSTVWSQGGPIIEREKIKTDPRAGSWTATIWNEAMTQNPAFGPTPLIAAMRAFVASRLGDEVTVPKELL